MQACPAALLAELDGHARLEVATVPAQELLENLQAFPLLEFSWAPYEVLCLEELLQRTRAFETWEDIEQMADPFETLRFLQARNLLHDEFLQALCQWCLQGVHKPNVRSERRPTARQLTTLYDHCLERGMEQTAALQDALNYYVESGGGIWQSAMPKPLKFRKRRRYIRSDDPWDGVELPDLGPIAPQLAQQSRQDDLLGLFAAPSSPPPMVVADDAVVEAKGSAPMLGRKKLSARSPLLSLEESTVRCWITSRKSPRPRHRRDPGLKKMLRTDMPRGPLWYHGGWETRPKYQQGQATSRYPWAGVPTGNNGNKRILRRS